MKRFVAVLMLAGGLLVAGGANARVDVEITESGGTVTVRSSGTLRSALCTSTSGVSGAGSQVVPNGPQIYFLSGSFLVCNGVSVAGPSFGTGASVTGNANTGAHWGFVGAFGGLLFVPDPFTSSTSFTNSFTISGSISSLGMTLGTYTYNLTNGATSDIIVVTIGAAPSPSPSPSPAPIPTLSEWSQMLLGLLVMTMIGWHFHRERSY